MSQQRAEVSIETGKVDIGASEEQRRQALWIIRRCSSCGRSMAPDEGDVLYGEKWFHSVCWALESVAKR